MNRMASVYKNIPGHTGVISIAISDAVFYRYIYSMRPFWLYALSGCLFIITGCSIKSLYINPEFNANNRSDGLNYRGFRSNLKYFLGYRVYDYKISRSRTRDSTIRTGILLNAQSIERDFSEINMLFGNGKDTCRVYCGREESVYRVGRSATVSLLNLLSKKEDRQPQQVRETSLSDGLAGYIDAAFGDTVSFILNSVATFTQMNGALLINDELYKLKPITEKIKKDGSTKKGVFLGVQLLKGDVVYGAIGFPEFLQMPDRVFLYSKATYREQFYIAAWFALISDFNY